MSALKGKIRPLASVLLVGLMVFGVAACGDDDDSSTTSDGGGTSSGQTDTGNGETDSGTDGGTTDTSVIDDPVCDTDEVYVEEDNTCYDYQAYYDGWYNAALQNEQLIVGDAVQVDPFLRENWSTEDILRATAGICASFGFYGGSIEDAVTAVASDMEVDGTELIGPKSAARNYLCGEVTGNSTEGGDFIVD